ncbi:MAG: M48 family metalloprotease [Verrucomicrobiota bacterium]
MTRTAFEALVRKIEIPALRRPALLRLSTVAGYAGFLFVLLAVQALGFSIALGALLDTKKDSAPMGGIGVLILVFGNAWILRLLWVGLSAPEGVAVTAAAAPRLMAEIARLRAAVGARPVFRVLLTPDCNAGVCEVPRFAFIGWPKNYLILGLPVMDELTPDEFRAVLAHEFAHLSRRHGRSGGWIYRLRRTWERVFEKWETGPASRGLARRSVRGWVRWWWPRFNARAFVLSRLCEYEADRAAARLTAPAHVAAGLLRIKVLAALINGPAHRLLLQKAAADAVPMPDYTAFLRRQRVSPEWREEAARAARDAWLIPTRNQDTHPSLTDRARSVGAVLETADIPEPVPVSAAREFLGVELDRFRAEIDALWIRENAAFWQARHTAAAGLNRLADSIGTRSRGGNAELLWEEARTLASLHGPAAAVPVLEKILALNPGHPGANLAMGGHLLETGDPERGESCLETAMAADPQTLHAAAGRLHDHYRRTGQAGRLQALDARLDTEEATRTAAEKERGHVTASDKFIPHTLTEEECAGLRALFDAAPGLAAVDLGQKLLRHRPDQRLFVLCLHGQGGFAGWGGADKAAAALRHLTPKVRLPGRLLMVAAGGPLAAIARKVARLPKARLWSEPERKAQ